MSDSDPTPSCKWPPDAPVQESFYVGSKCFVIRHPTAGGLFVEAGGVLPTGGGGFDPLQARLSYRFLNADGSASVDIELPEDFPFRASRKGVNMERTKSFLPDGNPVPEIRMLFALKTGSPAAAQAATETFPWEEWSGQSISEKLLAMNDMNGDWHHLKFLIGRRLVIAASKPNGLAEWALWEKIADDAANKELRRREIEKGNYPADNYGKFLDAVRSCTIKHKGLPAQQHVDIKFSMLGGIGAPREIRKTLGFEWLPAESDWTSEWLQSA